MHWLAKLNTYDGACSATIMDNFLFGLKQYFDDVGPHDDESKVGIMPKFLRGTAQLWWL